MTKLICHHLSAHCYFSELGIASRLPDYKYSAVDSKEEGKSNLKEVFHFLQELDYTEASSCSLCCSIASKMLGLLFFFFFNQGTFILRSRPSSCLGYRVTIVIWSCGIHLVQNKRMVFFIT